ncbi:MAG: ADOP family duplicated permease [Limisphaerales bacterium]
MRKLRGWFLRFAGLFNKAGKDREFQEELESHIQMHIEDNLRSGMTPEEARRQAMIQLGGIESTREAYREQRGLPLLDSLVQDLRYAWHSLLASPVFASASILSLALGIGANTAIFSILNAVMLRSLPVKEPHHLVQFTMDGNDLFTNPLWEKIRDRQNACGETLAYSPRDFDLAEEGERKPARGMWVSGDFFTVLGVQPVLGRLFTPEDDAHGGGKQGPVAVISYDFWQHHLGGEPTVIGKVLKIDRQSFEVIGVTPRAFRGLEADRGYEVAIPIGCEPLFHPDRSALTNRSTWWLSVLGRLQPGLTAHQASERLKVVAAGIMLETLPGDWDAEGQKSYLKQGLQVLPAAAGFSEVRSQYGTALLAVMTVVGFVLLIACANIANLLLARAAARRREFSIRMALGAGRSRLVRQLLTESLLLGSLGVPAGLVLAKWGSRFLVHLLSTADAPLQIDLSLDGTVLLFTLGLTVGTCLLFGLAPAFRAVRVAAHEALSGASRGTVAGASRFNLGKALVAGQVALCLVLMVAAGLFSATLRNVLREPLGFDQHKVLTIDIDTRQQVPMDQRIALFQTLLQKVALLPGVASAAEVAFKPISGSAWNDPVLPDGAEEKDSPDRVTWLNWVSPGYFKTMSATLLAGREFEERDKRGATKVVIIGEKTAHDFFGSRDPVGQYLRVGIGSDAKGRFLIIGVVKDMKYAEIREPKRRTAFLPMAQDDEPSPSTTIMARLAAPSRSVIPAIRVVAAETRPGLSLAFGELETQISESVRQERAVALLSSFFGGLALFLAVVGLYGLTSYTSAQRRGEIGIRIALGAQRNSVIWLVLRDVVVIMLLGSVVGLAIALSLGRLVASLVYGLSPHDGLSFLLAALVLSIAGVLAGVIPAWRASRLDPNTALRCE